MNMKVCLLLVLLSAGTIACRTAKNNKSAHSNSITVSTDLSNLPGASISIPQYNIRDVALINGKGTIKLDSVKSGVTSIYLNYPWNADPLADSSSNGNVAKQVKNKSKRVIGFSKKIYINPDQSKHYLLRFAKEIKPEVLENWTSQDYFKTDLYRVTVSSKSEDGRIYEKYDSLYSNFTGQSVFNILDSLYRISTMPDKKYDDFVREAFSLNRDLNYQTFVMQCAALIKENLGNPISPLIISNISQEYLVQNKKTFADLLNNTKGRALASQYYRTARLKLADKLSLEPGASLPLPIGKTPHKKTFSFRPADYKYTLIEFWAPWCAPCRAQNGAWNTLLSQYKSKGFQIVGVCLYNNIKEWKKAISEDNTTQWLHVSDLEHESFNGTNALTYALESIPYNFLLDGNGKILIKEISPKELGIFLSTKLQ